LISYTTVPARSYDNSRRAARAGDTGHRILDAAIALIGAPEPELSVARIAEHAGVAVPTVYKHFPNREAIFDAVQAVINERFGRPAWPATPEALRESVPRLHRFFAEHEPLVRAAVTSPALRPFWDVTRRRRDAALRRALQPATAHLSRDRAAAVAALVIRIVGAECWLELKHHWNLPDETITKVTVDALDAVLSALTRKDART
jgi:AcrR family transcriptional regulator